MKNSFFYSLAFLLLLVMLKAPVHAQIINGTDTLYCNEWINFNQSYFKIMLAEDGIYRIPFQSLSDAGVPVNSVLGAQFLLFHNGEEIPLHTSNDGTFGATDYLEFFGKKNTSELDRHLFKDAEAEMMNPYFSLITDTAAYFLTWNSTAIPLRYQTIQNDLTNLPPKEEYGWYDLTQVFTGGFDKRRNGEGVRNSYFDISEGYSSGYAQTQNFNITPVQPFIGNQNATLSLRYACGLGQHNQAIKINGQQAASDQFTDFQVKSHSLEIANASLSSQIQLTFEGMASNYDKQRVAYISLRYPRLFDAQNQAYFAFSIGASSERKYLEISGFNAGAAPVIYDLTNSLRLLAMVDGNIVKIALPPSNMERQLVLVNQEAAIKTVNILSPVQFINYLENEGNYVIISNRKLFDDGNGVNWVQEYANYRAAAAGGNYSPVVVEIQQLYDQFAWGIQRHPFSIRNFSHFILKNWSEPKYVFLVGKGREHTSIRNSSALNDPAALPLLVPTFGLPGSDNLLTASTWSVQPNIPVGRLPAVAPGEVKLYLDKVKTFEANRNLPQTITDRQWMKRVMHLGGGGPNEQNLIRSNLEAMENVLENNSFGAKTFSFYKTSADPIQVSQSQLISDLVNNGLSIVTFFGHSGSEGFDFAVDDPATYSNYGKYPLVLSLGCFSGQIHDNFRSIGERFVLQEQKGAIGFMASAGYGYVHALNQVAKSFYDKLGGEYYGQGIGKCLSEAFSEYVQSDFGTIVLIQQFTLHGDPALILNAFPTPDFTVAPGSVNIAPSKVNAQQPNFQFSFSVANIGKASIDSLVVEVSREFPNGSTLVVERRKIPSPKYETELAFTVPVLGDRAIGFNNLFVTLDPEDDIEEQYKPQAETNNTLTDASGGQGYRFYIFANGVIPVYPENFSIVSQPNLTLKATTSSVFASLQQYFFELDTTELFDSPFKKTTIIEKVGGVVEWQPGISWAENKAYYWRISPDTTNNQGFTWANSSFIYLKNSQPGWNQSHYFQVKKNFFKNTELSPATRRLKFSDNVRTIRILNGVYPTVWPAIYVDNDSYIYLPWDDPITGGIYVSVFDSVSIDPWINTPPGEFGSHISPWAYPAFYPFWTKNQAQREKLISFLRDSIPNGNYVSIFTIQTTSDNYRPEDWAIDSLTLGTNLFQILEAQGSNLLRSTATTGSKPFAMLYKKNDPTFIPSEIMVEASESFNHTFEVPGFWFDGHVESTLIGPSVRWDSLSWSLSDVEPATDATSLEVYGIKADSTRVLLFENIQANELKLSQVDAQAYPFLKLRYLSTDSILRTPPQLNHWRVFFKGLPDAAIDPSAHFSFVRDTLQEGENLHFETAIRNLTQNDMDSLLVKFSVVDEQNHAIEKLLRLAPLPVDGLLQADFQLNTKGIRGKQQLWLEVNPDLDQPELHTFNNVAIREFFVESDRRNPLVDVTFDGIHILNGDLVSTRPNIVITVEDENPYLALDDTSLFKVFLQYTDTGARVAIPFDGQVLQFMPANPASGKNKATLQFRPHFIADGKYWLLVQSKDASNNNSGEHDFKVSFQVITKSMISNMLNYPNPFSTATRFVYTLTGGEPPAQFKIQILTISGKIVREITQDEIGQLRIGTHQTEFVWDGTDEFGDWLANGVYLYRVLAQKANGEDFDMMENAGTDKYFKKGYGKMVIVR